MKCKEVQPTRVNKTSECRKLPAMTFLSSNAYSSYSESDNQVRPLEMESQRAFYPYKVGHLSLIEMQIKAGQTC
ncbi:hypothetical protein RchiOBHm_Chr2g0175111 [Rosa chinensis]|uniref:Uncharacterized protein n=1 Tax=Rosa chinensis TaxID=74649 RepID=A0A2P6S6A6_ROSCH|nr:hypothetical protein RchiOBHm_Chr2g0175111 [Rosa chinensis]